MFKLVKKKERRNAMHVEVVHLFKSYTVALNEVSVKISIMYLKIRWLNNWGLHLSKYKALVGKK